MKALKDRQGVVSVFLGTFPSREEFETYLEETYDEDRSEIGATCPFWTDLGVDWLDHDFQDAHYEGDVPVTLDVFFADPFSYLDSFRTDLLEACARQVFENIVRARMPCKFLTIQNIEIVGVFAAPFALPGHRQFDLLSERTDPTDLTRWGPNHH